MQEWPLAGRTEELDVIAEALGGAQNYAGVVITGVAGVGKTRLARESADAATARGWAVRWLTGTAAAQSVPLGAFAQWADRLDGHPLQLVGSVIAAVTASAGNAPVLVCVDDAHRLDDLSAFVLHQLVLRGSATVIVTIRTGEPVPDAVTALWKDGHLRRLDVQPLSRNQCDALLENVLGGPVSTQGAARIWQLTRGNVLFVREIVNHDLHLGRLIRRGGQWVWAGSTDLSAALVELVDLQLGAADESVLDVVDLVVLAEPLELVHLAALCDAEAMEEAERRGLIAVTASSPNDEVRLGHPLFGEVRLARAGRWRLARLRGRLARAMTASDSPVGQPDPVRLGLLWRDSDLPPDGAVFALAAQAAMQRMDLALAARFADIAIAAGAGVDAEIMLAHMHSLMSRGEDAERMLESLTKRQLPDAAWITTISLRAANLLWSLSRPEDSFAVVDEALAISSPACVAALLAFKAVQLATAGRPHEAVHIADPMDHDHLDALPAMMRTWALTIAHGDIGNAQQAAAAAAQGATLAAASPDVAFQGGGLAIYFADALVLGGYPSAASTLAQEIDAQLTDVPGAAQTNVIALKGFAALANGDVRTAVDQLGSASADYERSASTVGTEHFFGVAYVLALAMTGDAGTAARHMVKIQRNDHRAFVFLEPARRLAEAWVAAASGRFSQARAIATEAAQFASAHGQYAREVNCLQAAIQFGDTRQTTRLAELAQLVDGPRVQIVARWAAAVADHDGDALLAASRDLEVMGDRIAAADAAAHAAAAYSRHHRRGAALTAGGHAARIIAECGARTPATLAAAAPLPLSEREREVAILVSEGKSNKEIAQSLTVSVRTVEGHIYQACRRLGVVSRVDLARALTTFTQS